MARPRLYGGSPVTSVSPIKMRPPAGCTNPAMARSTVVFPDPEGQSAPALRPLNGQRQRFQYHVAVVRNAQRIEGYPEVPVIDGEWAAVVFINIRLTRCRSLYASGQYPPIAIRPHRPSSVASFSRRRAPLLPPDSYCRLASHRYVPAGPRRAR